MRLGPRPLFRSFSQRAGMRLAIANIGSGAHKSFALPIRKELRPGTQDGLRAPAGGEKAHNMVGQRDTQAGRFGSEFRFEVRRQIQYEAHQCYP